VSGYKLQKVCVPYMSRQPNEHKLQKGLVPYMSGQASGREFQKVTVCKIFGH